jgi:CelD/BcsL family acetyltransferase involved in cellulose biosynthesis
VALRLEPLEDLAAAREEWQALALAGGNVFSTWEWADAWWRHLGDGARLLAFTCRRPDGSAAAILPLCVRRGRYGLREAGWIGAGPADELGPVCAPADAVLAAVALQEAIARTRGRWDVMTLDGLRADEGWPVRLGAPPGQRTPSPVIGFGEGGWEAYLAGRQRKFRAQIRGRERRLEREHEVALRLVGEAAAVAPALDEVLRLHDLRWGAASTAFAGARRAFHHDFAARAHERGWLRIWLLELEGRPAAGWYGFRFGAADWFSQSGRDPQHESAGVGFVLVAHTIRAAVDDGMGAYRLLAGGEPYKLRFATEPREIERVVLAGGARGRAVLLSPAARRCAGRLGRRAFPAWAARRAA